MEQKRKTIEWHPAFTASLQIEFEDEEYEIAVEDDVEDDFDYDEWLAGCKEAEKEMA